jgi:hypothetical protein
MFVSVNLYQPHQQFRVLRDGVVNTNKKCIFYRKIRNVLYASIILLLNKDLFYTVSKNIFVFTKKMFYTRTTCFSPPSCVSKPPSCPSLPSLVMSSLAADPGWQFGYGYLIPVGYPTRRIRG